MSNIEKFGLGAAVTACLFFFFVEMELLGAVIKMVIPHGKEFKGLSYSHDLYKPETFNPYLS